MIEPPIPKTIKFAEAPAAGRSILRTSRSSKGAKAYREVADALVTRARRPAPKKRERRAAVTARPRYGRMALLCAAAGVTLVSVLGGMGALPSSADDAATARPRDGLVLSGAVAAPTPSGTGTTTAVPPSTVEQPVGAVAGR